MGLAIERAAEIFLVEFRGCELGEVIQKVIVLGFDGVGQKDVPLLGEGCQLQIEIVVFRGHSGCAKEMISGSLDSLDGKLADPCLGGQC